MAQQVRSADSVDHGEWLAIESDTGEIVYVWSCGCCTMTPQLEKPPVLNDEWKVVEL